MQTIEKDLPGDLQNIVRFHGHLCPGLVIGYRAAKAAAGALGAEGSPDEELVAVVENDSCSVDAFQALLSTTFGKGNFVFNDFGKQVFTLGDRATGRAVRVSLREDAFGGEDLSREEKVGRLLDSESEKLFDIRPVNIKLPAKAEIHETLRCDRCREGVMSTRTVPSDDMVYCLPCARDLGLPDPFTC